MKVCIAILTNQKTFSYDFRIQKHFKYVFVMNVLEEPMIIWNCEATQHKKQQKLVKDKRNKLEKFTDILILLQSILRSHYLHYVLYNVSIRMGMLKGKYTAKQGDSEST